MILLQLLPVVVSLLVLGAHFLRGGHVVFVALVIGTLALLGVRRRWAARVVQGWWERLPVAALTCATNSVCHGPEVVWARTCVTVTVSPA